MGLALAKMYPRWRTVAMRGGWDNWERKNGTSGSLSLHAERCVQRGERFVCASVV
jgi:hypothetical protein